MYRRRRIAAGILALLVLGGVYTVAIALTPLPELRGALSVEAELRVDADPAAAQAAVDAQSRPTAIGWLHDEEVWSNDDGPHRIASLTKLVTVLVGLEAAPVEAGGDGPVYTVSGEDQRILDEVIAQDGSFAPTPAGLELTTRQMLELILLPSANNYAIAYTRWVFGSDEAYLDAAHDWLARNGLESMRIFDASGLNDENTASAADIVRLSRLVLANPLLAEIVAQSSIEIPALGEITTTNRLLADPGVIGLKTGTTFPEGYSLAAAQRESTSGRDLVAIAVVLDRVDADARAADAREALTVMAAAWQTLPVVAEGESIGSVTTWTGERVPLVATSSADAVLVPGESASRTIELGAIEPGPAGGTAGTVRITAPDGEREVPIVAQAEIEKPGLFWKMTHPGALLSPPESD